MDNGVIKIMRWVLAAFGIMLILALIFMVFIKPNQNHGSTGGKNKAVNINDYKTSGNMQFVQDGNITAPENHYKVVINISSSSRSIYIYNGYGTAPTVSKSFTNNQASYDAFLGALQGVKFTSSKTANNGININTYCSLGIRYSYQIVKGDQMPMNTWSPTCNPSAGTYAGSTGQTKQLFTNQIPQYQTVMRGVRL